MRYYANSADPVQRPQNVASELGLHCSFTRISVQNTVKMRISHQEPLNTIPTWPWLFTVDIKQHNNKEALKLEMDLFKCYGWTSLLVENGWKERPCPQGFQRSKFFPQRQKWKWQKCFPWQFFHSPSCSTAGKKKKVEISALLSEIKIDEKGASLNNKTKGPRALRPKNGPQPNRLILLWITAVLFP